MKKYVALLLIAAALLTLAACGSKDALAGTWSADLEMCIRDSCDTVISPASTQTQWTFLTYA